MGPHTDWIESAAGAFSGRSTTFDGPRRFQSNGGPRSHRRAHDRGTVWVRITLLVVVSALLLCVVGSSKARYASDGHTAPSSLQTER